MKRILKYSLTLITISLFATSLTGQVERTREVDQSWPGIKEVVVNHRHGTLEVVPSNDDQVRLEARIMVRAKDGEDAQALIDHIDINIAQFTDELTIETQFNTKSWTTSNNTTRVRFTDGTKATGIKDYQIKFKVYVPDLESLSLSNKYNDIIISENLSSDVTIRQYDGDVRTKRIEGDLNLSLKYGKAEIEHSGKTYIESYDSSLEIKTMGECRVDAKYSDLVFGATGAININSYDGSFSAESIDGELRFEDKYSTYQVGSAGDVYMTLYDGKLNIGSSNSLNGKSKYASISLGTVHTIDLTASNQDVYSIEQFNTLKCAVSKYSKYNARKSTGKIDIRDSYDDKVIVNAVASQFEGLNIDCKYSEVRLPLNDLSGYLIEATVKYGTLKYPEPSTTKLYKKTDSLFEVEATIGQPTNGAKVKINSYDSQIHLN